MSGQLCLKWNNHSVAILKNVSNIQMRERYCDATIVCQGRYFPVHRIILSTCSEYFDEIFERMQCQHPYIVFKDTEPREMELLLNYMYQGEVNVLQDMLPTLIKAAEALRIRGLAVSDEIFSTQDTSLAKKQTNFSKDTHPRKSKFEESQKQTHSLSFSLPSKVTDSEDCSSSVSESKSQKKSTPLPVCIDLKNIQPQAIKEEPLDTNEYSNTIRHHGAEILNNDPVSLVRESTNKKESIFPTFSTSDVPTNFIKDEEAVSPKRFRVQTPRGDFPGGDAVQSFTSIEMTNQDGGFQGNEAFDLPESSLHIPIGLPNGRKDRNGVNRLGHIFVSRKSTDFHQCPHCNYEGLSHNVRRHIKYKHTRERPFVCCLCPAQFTEKITLKRHMRIHTGERPFHCPTCPKKFSSKFNLTNHIASKHETT